MSAHLYVDSKSVYQTLSLSNVGWHSGSSEVNERSIGIEMCLATNTELQEKTIHNTKLLIEELKAIYGEDIKVVFHKDVSGKDCPSMVYKDGWILYGEEELKEKLGI